MAGNSIIKVENLTKKFGELTAVDNISFEVQQGQIFALLGPNGAGKTTTIKMLTTLLIPNSGQILLDNVDVQKNQEEARKKFGIVFQDPSLDDKLTAYENLEIHGILYQVPSDLRNTRIEELLKFVGKIPSNGPSTTFSPKSKSKIQPLCFSDLQTFLIGSQPFPQDL